jgi:predicted permease
MSLGLRDNSDDWGLAMTWISADIRQGWRRLASTPGLSLGAVLTLAVGIGCTVLMADVLDRLLIREPSQVSEPDRVRRVYVGRTAFMDIAGYETLAAMATVRPEIEAVAGYYDESVSFGEGERARQLHVTAASPDYFRVLGVHPALGTWPVPAGNAAVLSYGTWQQDFGGSNEVIGKPLRLDSQTYTISAVAPRGFHGVGTVAADVWLPLEMRARAAYGDAWRTMQAVFLHAIVRVQTDVNLTRVNDRATAAFRATASSFQKKSNVVLGDLRLSRAPGVMVGTRVEVLIAAVSVIVLVIACGNVANILLIRGLRRAREFSIKTALGASRGRLIREVVVEASLLAAAAGVIALFVVGVGGSLVRDLLLPPVAALADSLDVRVLLTTAAVSGLAAFVLGLIPAVRLTTRTVVTPGPMIATRPSRLLEVLGGMQVALSLPLLVGAGLFVLSLWHARGQDFGMQTDHLVVVSTNLFSVGRPFENQTIHREMQVRLSRLPQVESTALVENVPMRHSVSMLIDGKLAQVNGVDPAFFTVMRMRLTEGRLFTDNDNRKAAAPVAVVTDSLARSLWPGQSALGKCLPMGEPGSPCPAVVGIVADARLIPQIRPTAEATPACYFPLEQRAASTNRALLVRTTGDPAAVLQMLRKQAQTSSVNLPYVDAYVFDELFMNLLKPWRLGSLVFVVFGALSIIIASVGLVLIGAYAVARRVREIGIRSALGAQPQQIVLLVLQRSLFVIFCGLTVGLGLAWAGGRVINTQLFGIAANDLRVIASAAAAVLAVGVFAAWLPARRAAGIDPVVALRVIE